MRPALLLVPLQKNTAGFSARWHYAAWSFVSSPPHVPPLEAPPPPASAGLDSAPVPAVFPVEGAPVPPPELTPSAQLPDAPSAHQPLLVAALTTALVTAASYLASDRYAATLVGMTFLAATWFLVLRHDERVVRSFGLSLGGLLEPAALEPRRLLRDALTALAWVLVLVAVIFPLFWLGYRF